MYLVRVYEDQVLSSRPLGNTKAQFAHAQAYMKKTAREIGVDMCIRPDRRVVEWRKAELSARREHGLCADLQA